MTWFKHIIKTLKSHGVTCAREICYRTGLYGLLHRIRNARTLTVLMFHRVLPTESEEYHFAEQEYTFSVVGFGRCLDFVKKHYKVVSLTDVIDACEGKYSLPKCAALITFDDGWRDNILYALPELQHRGFPSVLFLSTEVVDLPNDRWWQDALVEIVSDSKRAVSLAQELGCESLETVELHELTSLIAIRPPSEREELLAGYVAVAGVRQMVKRSDIATLDMQWLSVASHGHTHVPLTQLRELQNELEMSKKIISELGGASSVISLPHGDFDDRVVKLIRDVGFCWIFNSMPALNTVDMIVKSRHIARIHVPENHWTCDNNGRVSDAKLASFLFPRAILD